LECRTLSSKGLKSQLIARLMKAVKSEQEQEEEAPADTETEQKKVQHMLTNDRKTDKNMQLLEKIK